MMNWYTLLIHEPLHRKKVPKHGQHTTSTYVVGQLQAMNNMLLPMYWASQN